MWSATYILHSSVLRGVMMTCQLTFLVMVVGSIIGVIVALMRLSTTRFSCSAPTPICGSSAELRCWCSSCSGTTWRRCFQNSQLGIPFGGPKFFEISSTVAISSFVAAMLGLSLNEGAYMAEIIRAGILSVDPGQGDASKALGYRPMQTFWVVVLPQAMKAIVPPTGNQVIGMLKFTSLASFVALQELMFSVESIYTRTFETIPLLIVAALWYLFLVSVLSVVQYFIERYYSKGWRELRMPVNA